MIRLKKWIGPWIPLFALCAVLLFVKMYVGQLAYIPTGSMIPTLLVHDILIVDKTPKPKSLHFGDVVVFNPPDEAGVDKVFIKRLIGLPGDTIEVSGGRLWRNGVPVDEPYLLERSTYKFGPLRVPKDKYIVLGDNRNDSYDSHEWPNPFVDADQMIGRAIYRVFPFNRFGKIS